jgi:formylglycine-generating enzyme required for sulfatase activity
VAVGLALPWVARWQGVLRVESAAPDVPARALRPALIELPGGTFVMGSPATEPGHLEDEGPQHRVAVSPFLICQTEVTQEQWEAVMGENPSDCAAGCDAKLPVQNVSWYDAIAYLNELTTRENAARGESVELTRCYEVAGETVEWKDGCTGYRLPTEAEWEYAARAGTRTAYSFGDDAGKLGDHAWYGENAGGQVHEVGTRNATPWGLHDVHGNVWEWVWDWYEPYWSEAATDPRGPKEAEDTEGSAVSRALRGGSFGFRSGDLRSASRYGDRDRYSDLGLRCARGVSPAWPIGN